MVFLLSAATAQCECAAPNTGMLCTNSSDCTGKGLCVGDFTVLGTKRLYAAYPLVGVPTPVTVSPTGYCCEGGPAGGACPILGRPDWYRP
jgi:hypothetical protein